MSWLKRLFVSEEKETTPLEPTDYQKAIFEQASGLMKIINESLQISNNSTNPQTKVSRLELARSNLDSLVLLSSQNPFIKLQRLDGVRKTIDELSSEYGNAGYYALTDQSCRTYQHDVWRGINIPASDLVTGWRFIATMQLRTPLRILNRHGEVHQGLAEPPHIAKEQWEGFWTPELKTLRELTGLNIDDFMADSMASDIGEIPSDGGSYLKFLLKVRAIVEQVEPIETRRLLLRDELRKTEWAEFCQKLGGKQAIQSSFFPAFIDVIKGLPKHSVSALWDSKLTTPERISKASDVELRAIKGVGPAKLKAIRDACAAATNPMSEYVDKVDR